MQITETVIDALRPYQFRGKRRLFDALVPHSGERIADVFGYRMTLDLSRKIQRDVFIGNYEREESRIIRKLLKPGMTVIDAGANFGYYSALAASIVGPSGRVIAVEPYPPNFQRLNHWIRDNRVGHLTPYNFALGRCAGRGEMFSAYDDTDAPVMVAHGHSPVASVDIRTLDACVEEWSVGSVDFLKVDVDGYETELFAGARRALSERRIRSLLCEFCEEWLIKVGSSTSVLWQAIVAAGFKAVWPGPTMPQSSLFNALFIHH